MTGSPPLPPSYWLTRALEVRDAARATKNPEIRREMETIAALYEKLAEWAERRQLQRGED